MRIGGSSTGPTVITPKQYKLRFRSAMDAYLLIVSCRNIPAWFAS